MYGLAGMAAEAIGGKPYFELMREKLLEPLNITTAVMVDNLDYGQTLTSKPHQMINGSVKRSDFRFYRYYIIATHTNVTYYLQYAGEGVNVLSFPF